jgi:hypothetical protein
VHHHKGPAAGDIPSETIEAPVAGVETSMQSAARDPAAVRVQIEASTTTERAIRKAGTQRQPSHFWPGCIICDNLGLEATQRKTVG